MNAMSDQSLFAPPGVSLMALEEHHCRWVIGGPHLSSSSFCGLPKARGSYCEDHARLAYLPSDAPRPRTVPAHPEIAGTAVDGILVRPVRRYVDPVTVAPTKARRAPEIDAGMSGQRIRQAVLRPVCAVNPRTMTLATPTDNASARKRAIASEVQPVPQTKGRSDKGRTRYRHPLIIRRPKVVAAPISAARPKLSDFPHFEKIPVATIQDAVAICYCVSPDEMRSATRTMFVSWARQLCMWLVCKSRPDLSLKQVGNIFGGKDHTTVLFAYKKLDTMWANGDLTIPDHLRNMFSHGVKRAPKGRYFGSASPGVSPP